MLTRSLMQNHPPIALQEEEPGPSVSLQTDDRRKYVQANNSQVSSEQTPELAVQKILAQT